LGARRRRLRANPALTAPGAPSYGYLTWEWFAALRGWAHPLLFAALYRALAALRLDTPAALVLAPRLLQAACQAAGDVATFVLARRLFGARAARGALLCALSSWFGFYAGARTFSSSLEAPLCAAALALWPWRAAAPGALAPPGAHLAAALTLAAAACIARPAAAALLLPLAAREVLGGRERAVALLRRALPVAAVALAASAAVDRALYGRWVCVPWRFVSFNVLTNGAAAYGTHPWHWYASSGAPTVLGALTPLVLAGVALAAPRRRALAASAAFCAAALSASAHKEFRFLLPLLPPACAYAGAALAALHDGASPPGLKCVGCSAQQPQGFTLRSHAAPPLAQATPRVGALRPPRFPARCCRARARACRCSAVPVAVASVCAHTRSGVPGG
jgi:phosphatidylinositol glycan class B